MSKYLDNDGLLYLWNSKIKPLVAKYLPLTGGTLTGKLTLGAAPNADMDAATKKYVDDSVASAGGGDMLKSVYDKDGNGVVDDAQKVNGHTVEKDVPADAVFTDTKYEAATASSPGLMTAADYSKLAAFSAASDYAKRRISPAFTSTRAARRHILPFPRAGIRSATSGTSRTPA